MQKKSIYLIVGLLGAAVIGLIGLQMNLMRTSLGVTAASYDKSVETALQSVVDELEEHELQIQNWMNNGFTMRNDNGGITSFGNYRSSINNSQSILEGFSSAVLGTDRGAGPLSKAVRGFHETPLYTRISLNLLDQALREELTKHRIDGAVEYGVYDMEESRFIIHDGRQYRNEEAMLGDTTRLYNLFRSKYQTPLFVYNGRPAGFLIANFADRNAAIWSELWLSVAASLFFTLIILGCFGYTLYVIFRQKKVSEMKTDFINNMTHEFKTPIATISLATDSIISPKVSGNPDKVARFANIIKQENKRMNSQVEKVLQMAKLDKQTLKLKLTPVDLHQIINNAAEYISLQVEPRGGQVSTDLAASSWVVEGDQTHLSNVINNLLDNANKYSPDAPVIRLSTRNLSNGVEVTVSDQGMGMSREARKHVFDRFYRVHTGDRHDVKGFGLGLSYVKTIVEAHGGSVSVKSELGKGSSFSVFFPFKQASK